ncbi:BarH-like 1 homeobox protein [Acipenser ruthenus]|uniref:BarH-like 1 homeobox protein n=1 Tax=Acipenser ruthenus TaxID=7906 RepID=A0A444V148_ACIRT|nr:BarH-like 1 homeobox protein [Acipenser ruthenus]
MEASANGSSFGIDSLLSHRPGSPVLSKGDSLMGECRSPLELSPGSDLGSGCSSPPSPRRECVEAAVQRQAHPLGLDSHLQRGGQVSGGSQPRTVTSSFLIRDILADCKPLAACAPYSSHCQPTQDPGSLASRISDDFIDKADKIHSNSSSDTEYRVYVLIYFSSLLFFPPQRTKWKRQTAVGLELLAEAGNYSALQRMFPSPYFYPQSLVSNLDPGAALYLYRGPSAPPPALQRPLVPRILLHGLQGGSDPPQSLPSLAGVLSRAAQPR